MGGDTECAFCGQQESQTHLFFQCSMARLLWNILKCTFNLLRTPDNVDDLLDKWILQFDKKTSKLLMVGVCALLWAIWRIRNKLIFEGVRITDPCAPVAMLTMWLSDWVILQRNQENQDMLKKGVIMYEVVAKEIFKRAAGWSFNLPRLVDGG